MLFDGFDSQHQFMEAWNAIRIVRTVPYTLFTFGESDLEYYLVTEPAADAEQPLVNVRRGEVKVTRPLVLTPDSMGPEFEDFFESDEEQGIASFLLSRTASFGNLKFVNQAGPGQIVSDSVEEAVDRLQRQLDDEEEDRVAILTAPAALGGIAVMRYALERVAESLPGNLQELRERGFLPPE